MSPPRARLVLVIVLGSLAILFTIGVLVGWNIIFARFYSVATESRRASPGVGYWILVSIGSFFLTAVIATLVMFLVSHVRKTRLVQQQEAFIDRVTHELRSPLASLRLSLETLQQRQLSDVLRGRFLSGMQDELDRLGGFIEQVLAAGQLTRREEPLEGSAFVLCDLVRECVEDVASRHRLDPCPIQAHFGAGMRERRITIDAVAVRTILVNLLDNAIKYSKPPHRVVVRIERASSETMTIDVCDNGIGLASDQLKKVFRRFYRAPRASGKPVRGSGLGLYLVQTLARRLGGRAQAESEGENRGATFRVVLPLHGGAT